MLPLLRYLGDQQEHSISDCRKQLAVEFSVSEEELDKLLPSGSTTIFNSRVGWAKTYLLKAGLLESPKKGRIRITQVGIDALSKGDLKEITNQFLLQFSSFAEFFRGGTKNESPKEPVLKISPDSINSPDEAIETNSQLLREKLMDDILERVLEKDSRFFERLVLDLLKKMGYGALDESHKITGGSGDGGIDGIIDEDALGLDKIYIQAKRYDKDASVGRPVIQSFIGAIAGNGGSKGVFITTCKFTKDAIEYRPQNNIKLVLIDGKQLARLMFKYNLGCSVERVYEVKKIDSDYFDEEYA